MHIMCTVESYCLSQNLFSFDLLFSFILYNYSLLIHTIKPVNYTIKPVNYTIKPFNSYN